ncbi:MAG: amidohydrolase [Candidatus Hydrogenedentota bacterium]
MKEIIRKALPELVALRHELHQHPEIRFEEQWTSDRIAQFLEAEGIEHTRGHARGTGIIATIKGEGSKTVALRSDMDALEIEEDTGVEYRSTIPKRMHACGHDGHMACLCGTARVLNQLRGELGGTVKLIFQPAEEQAAGGRLIVEEGILDDVDSVFALHCWPSLPVGQVGIKSGPAMASADFFNITVTGEGCHAADPASGVDPVLVAAHILSALQSVVSRETNPWDPAVLSVARIEAGHASNVIPETAIMEGTFRALSDEVRKHIFEAIPRIAEHTARAHRAVAHVRFDGEPYPFLNNDPAMSAFAKDTVREVFGDDRLYEPRFATMASEDFAFYLQQKPGAFLFLGSNPDPNTRHAGLHSPHFNFCDEALPIGIELMSSLAMRSLAKT